MSNRWARWLLILNCLALATVGVSARAVAADSSKTWPSKKKKKHHKTHHKASTSTSTSTKAGAAPAEDANGDEEGGDEGGDDEADKAEKDEPVKSKPAKKEKADKDADKADKSDDDEREASDERGGGDEGGEDLVIHRKARHVADESGPAPVAFELSVGPRLVHRTFDFNDPLSNHVAGAPKPYSYVLPAGPAPFVDLGFYPAALGVRGPLANFGIVGSYEKLIATKTQSSTSSTDAQQFEIGVRGRLPLGDHEAGLAASYGKQTFHVTEADLGPQDGGTIPNVDYTFVDLNADGRLHFNPITIGAHLGTRFVTHTGALGKMWYPTVKTTAIEAGLSAAYRLTPLFEIVAGADLMRYAFDFNPVSTATSGFVAGGAVDQYISGYLALRVTFSGG
jgi:hypothetical protein